MWGHSHDQNPNLEEELEVGTFLRERLVNCGGMGRGYLNSIRERKGSTEDSSAHSVRGLELLFCTKWQAVGDFEPGGDAI